MTNKDYYNNRIMEFGFWLKCAEEGINPPNCNMFQKNSPETVIADVSASIYADAAGCRRDLAAKQMDERAFEAFLGYHVHLMRKAAKLAEKHDKYASHVNRYLDLLLEIEIDHQLV